MTESVPVIAIDGPAASGKGTIAQLVARELGFHYLDSGALYRIGALVALRAGVAPEDEALVTSAIKGARPRFESGRIYLGEEDITGAIRTEEVSVATSRIAVHPRVRQALFDWQRSAKIAPGLVADGRDMGTVVFPDAELKIFLTASPRVRAKRRFDQLIERGVSADLEALTRDLEERDRRDSQRAVAPLKPADDARILESSEMGIDEVLQKVLAWWHEVAVK